LSVAPMPVVTTVLSVEYSPSGSSARDEQPLANANSNHWAKRLDALAAKVVLVNPS
jgi:hypothetical protein